MAQQPITLKGHEAVVASVVFSPDGKILATGDAQGIIKLWDVATGKELKTIDGHETWVFSLSFSPDGKTLASGSGALQPRDKTVKLWEVPTGKDLGEPEGRTGYVEGVAFAPDGKTLAFGGSNGYVKLWEVGTKKPPTSLEAGFVIHSLAYAPDGKTLAAGGGGGIIKVWDAVTGRELHHFQAQTKLQIHELRYSPESKSIAFVNYNGNSIGVWDLETGRNQIVLEAGQDEERTICLAFAPDGKTVATGTIKGVLQLRDVSSWKMLASVPSQDGANMRLAFSPDAKLLAGGAKIWDVAKILERKTDK